MKEGIGNSKTLTPPTQSHTSLAPSPPSSSPWAPPPSLPHQACLVSQALCHLRIPLSSHKYELVRSLTDRLLDDNFDSSIAVNIKTLPLSLHEPRPPLNSAHYFHWIFLNYEILVERVVRGREGFSVAGVGV